MRRRRRWLAVGVLVFAAGTAAIGQTPALRVVRADPAGPLTRIEDADQIRVVFSEPMVPLGVVPDGAAPPWIRITPDVPGSFYWSGTRTLIFSPDAWTPIPHATTFTVRVDASAVSAAGRRLEAPYALTFTTPTLRLLGASWYRKDGRIDNPVVIGLRFSHRVRPEDVAAHARVARMPHALEREREAALTLSREERRYWQETDPEGLDQFDAKVRAVRAVAGSSQPVAVRLADAWDERWFGRDPWLVVLETITAPPPETMLRVTVDGSLPSAEGPEPTGPQSEAMTLEAAFFARVGVGGVWLTQPVSHQAVARALTVGDVTGGTDARPLARAADGLPDRLSYGTQRVPFEALGFPRQPLMTQWTAQISEDLESGDGQRLEYRLTGLSARGHAGPLLGFAGTVFEAGRGPQLPLVSRNLSALTQWLVPIDRRALMPRLLEIGSRWDLRRHVLPDTPGERRSLPVRDDTIQLHATDVSRLLSPGGTGLVWAAADRALGLEGRPVQLLPETRSAILQVTNLGITAKHGPQSSLIFVTRLDTGDPVAGARVAIVDTGNTERWSGATGRDGVAIAPAMDLSENQYSNPSWLVTAELDGDIAFVPWWWSRAGSYGTWWDRLVHLRGGVFTDRGVYRQQEEVRFKAIVREDTPTGVARLPPGTRMDVVVRGGQGEEADRRTVALSRLGSAEWSWTVPAGASLGEYAIAITRAGEGGDDERVPSVEGAFRVAAPRLPDFRVDAAIDSTPAARGAVVRGRIEARYLFGAPLGSRPVTWSVVRRRVRQTPAAIRDRFPDTRYAVGPVSSWAEDRAFEIPWQSGALDGSGRLTFELTTPPEEDSAVEYTVEGSVGTVAEQALAARASTVVHPALYVALSRPSPFVDTTRGAEVRVAAVALDGQTVPGVRVDVTLLRQEWSYPADGGAGVMRETPAGTWPVTTTAGEAPIAVTVPEAGSYVLRAIARDATGRSTRTEQRLYGIGRGRPAWLRDESRVELTPERTIWKPGETARILVHSPWARATALVTVEREGVRRHQTRTLTAADPFVQVPITEDDVPNVFVSVVLVKGRTADDVEASGADPGRPQYRAGEVELTVDAGVKRLDVEVSAERSDLRPGESAAVSVRVTDAAGRPVRAEVTLWAVDYGVLSLTGYRTPDLLPEVYVPRRLQVRTADNRDRLARSPGESVSLEGETPPFPLDGGQSLVEVMNARAVSAFQPRWLWPGDGVRDDFRPLAFWVGSLQTDAGGRARTTARLPDSLTTYRIMAVAHDDRSRVGAGDTEIRASKTLTLLPALPRFLSAGDRASFGATVTYTGAAPGEAIVTIESRDPDVVQVGLPASRRVRLAPGVSQAVRFDAVAAERGGARIRMTVRLGDETDAFEVPLPVTAPLRPAVTAAYGEVGAEAAVEAMALPPGSRQDLGGLDVQLASTALVGLGESARYVTDAPYDVAEPQASRGLVFLLASELGAAFRLSDVPPEDYRAAGALQIRLLSTFQCPGSGGFSFLPEPKACGHESAYLTAYVLHVFHVGRTLGIAIDDGTVNSGLDYLDYALSRGALSSMSRPWHAVAVAYAAKVLAEYGRPRDAQVTSLLSDADALPLVALSFLADALYAAGETGPRYQDVVRRLTNALRVEADRAHVEEADEDDLSWIWIDTVASTAIVLEGFARRGDAPEFAAPLVRWLNAVRTNGRWTTTHANARALEALVAYYRAFEAGTPRMTAQVAIGDTSGARRVGSASFRGRSTVAEQVIVPMRDLLARLDTPEPPVLSIARSGTGRLYYTARVQAFVPEPRTPADRGFHVERTYTRFDAPGGDGETTFSAGDVVRVTVTVAVRGEGRFLVLTDPLPAGFEPVDGAFETTDRRLAREAVRVVDAEDPWSWRDRGTFEHLEQHDDRVVAYATRLGSGRHQISYLLRATTRGTFGAAGARLEAIYAPELTGRSAAATIEIR